MTCGSLPSVYGNLSSPAAGAGFPLSLGPPLPPPTANVPQANRKYNNYESNHIYIVRNWKWNIRQTFLDSALCEITIFQVPECYIMISNYVIIDTFLLFFRTHSVERVDVGITLEFIVSVFD